MTEPARRLKANKVIAESSCGACKRPLAFGADAALCNACSTAHHAACWDTVNGCSNPACVNAPLEQLPDAAPIPAVLDESRVTCTGCGTAYSSRRDECPQCRRKTPTRARSHARPLARGNAPGAVASLVFGILSLIICGVIFGIVAIVKSNEARRAIARNPNLTGGGMAVAGLVLGILGLALWALIILGKVAG